MKNGGSQKVFLVTGGAGLLGRIWRIHFFSLAMPVPDEKFA